MVSILSVVFPGGLGAVVGFLFAGIPGAVIGVLVGIIVGTTIGRLDELERRVDELEIRSRSSRSVDR